MIRSFSDANTEAIFGQRRVRSVGPAVARAALRKLLMLHAASRIEDLRVPPGNRLEALKGRRAGQWSIRVNDQWRLCFRWESDGAHAVELTDYH